MRGLMTFALTWATTACVARTPLPTPPREDPLVWFSGLRTVLPPLAPPVPITPNPEPVFATLGELAENDLRDECGTCHTDECSCFETRARWVLRGHEGFDEVRLIAYRGSAECDWSLVAKAHEGWLRPIAIGTSPAGCKTLIDADTLELGGDWWYPLASAQDPQDPAVFRIEGEGASIQDLYQGGPDVVATRRIDRVVFLCRLDVHTFACAKRTTPARVVASTMHAPIRRGQALRALRERIPTALTNPILPDPAFAPPTDAAHIGRDWDAEWLVRPSANSERALLGFGSGILQRVPFRPGQDVVVASGERYVRIMLARGTAISEASVAIDYLANGACHLEGIATSPGVVRVRIARTIDGGTGGTGAKDGAGTSVSIVWHWEEIFVAAPTARAFRLLTGVTLARSTTTVAGWRREVVPEAGGLRLVERAGAIAWFRGTGRYTWDGLAGRLAGWRAQMAEAFQAVPAPVHPTSTRRASNEFSHDEVGWLELLPGYIEPLFDVFADEVLPLD